MENGKMIKGLEMVNHFYSINSLGKYTYTNGDEYDGEWSDGKRNGRGKSPFLLLQQEDLSIKIMIYMKENGNMI